MDSPLTFTCADLADLATDYLECLLGDDEQVRFEMHMVNCPDCIAYLDQLRRTAIVISGLPRPELAAELKSRMVDALLAGAG